jgi:tyrosyl-tRNA synthetase
LNDRRAQGGDEENTQNKGGGVSINKEKVGAPEQVIKADALINNRYLVVQRGKKNYYLCNIN